MNNNTVKIFVYGTLKKGKRLHDFFMKNAEFIKKDEINAKMFNLGSYPAVIKTRDKEAWIEGEIYKIPNRDFNMINVMESNAGYIAKEIKSKSDEKVLVFYFKNEDIIKSRNFDKISVF